MFSKKGNLPYGVLPLCFEFHDRENLPQRLIFYVSIEVHQNTWTQTTQNELRFFIVTLQNHWICSTVLLSSRRFSVPEPGWRIRVPLQFVFLWVSKNSWKSLRRIERWRRLSSTWRGKRLPNSFPIISAHKLIRSPELGTRSVCQLKFQNSSCTPYWNYPLSSNFALTQSWGTKLSGRMFRLK